MGCRGNCTVSTMESSSLKRPGASGTSCDAAHGLKFGQKIYFDDGGASGSSSKSQPAPAKEAPEPPPAPAPAGKKGKGASQGGQQQPPRCQVEGCNVDLTGAKAYYCRHKVCGMHSKAPKVVVAGLEQRFCQQCSRFHLLPEFDQGKRSCRRRLAGHNERRRKPPPGPFASRYGRFSASFQEEPSRHRSFVMDFSYPNLSGGTARDLWPYARAGHRAPAAGEWHGPFDAAAMHPASHPCFPGPPAAGGPFCAPMELPPGECLAGVSDSSCALSLLSTDPWSGSSDRGHAPGVTAASTAFDGPPAVAHSVVPGNYIGTTSSWGLIRGPGGGSRTSSHDEIQHDLGLVGPTTTEPRVAPFSSQVDFALPENGQCLEEHSSARAYDHFPGPDMHWSL